MRKLILSRKYTDKETQGTFIIFDDNMEIFRCKCLELPWLNNQHNISCIPEGIYDVQKYSDSKHPNTFWVKNVSGRDGILIHIGNFANGTKIDTEGCLLPGIDFVDIDGNGTLDITGPDIAMKALNYFLPNSFKLIIC
jgi:hypothetical protein